MLLLTNYSGSTGFGEEFARSIQGDPLKGPADEINEAADAAIKRFSFIDGSRQCAGGASYGGHLANWLQGTTTRYKCLVSHAGLVNLESQWGTSDTIYSREVEHRRAAVGTGQRCGASRIRFATPRSSGRRCSSPSGENDFRVPLNNSLEYWSALQRMQVPSRLIVFPDENHWILKGEDSRLFYAEIAAWLGRWLAPAAAKESRILSDEWDFYFARVNDAVSSIFVDLGIRPDVPIEKRPWLLWVCVQLLAPKPDGLATNEEARKLHEIGEALTLDRVRDLRRAARRDASRARDGASSISTPPSRASSRRPWRTR